MTVPKVVTILFSRVWSCSSISPISGDERTNVGVGAQVLVLHMKRFVPNLALQNYDKCFDPVSIDQSLNIGGLSSRVGQT